MTRLVGTGTHKSAQLRVIRLLTKSLFFRENNTMKRRRRYINLVLVLLIQLINGSIIERSITEGLDEGNFIFNIPQEIGLTNTDYTFKVSDNDWDKNSLTKRKSGKTF